MRKQEANRWLGFFSLDVDRLPSTVFVDQYEDLAKMINSNSVVDLEDYGKAMMVTKRPAFRKRRDLKSNCMVCGGGERSKQLTIKLYIFFRLGF